MTDLAAPTERAPVQPTVKNEPRTDPGTDRKKGHRLRSTASGDDAQQALHAIEEAINSGLGEGAA